MAGPTRIGTSAAVLGYPLDGRFDAEPARLGQTNTVNTQNAYGQSHVVRSLTALRGLVRPGNSGGPLVNSQGQVLATVFAALTDAGRSGGFAIPNDVVAAELHKALARGRTVADGHCG
jgi:S1-C subfamily serine protease